MLRVVSPVTGDARLAELVESVRPTVFAPEDPATAPAPATCLGARAPWGVQSAGPNVRGIHVVGFCLRCLRRRSLVRPRTRKSTPRDAQAWLPSISRHGSETEEKKN